MSTNFRRRSLGAGIAVVAGYLIGNLFPILSLWNSYRGNLLAESALAPKLELETLEAFFDPDPFQGGLQVPLRDRKFHFKGILRNRADTDAAIGRIDLRFGDRDDRGRRNIRPIVYGPYWVDRKGQEFEFTLTGSEIVGAMKYLSIQECAIGLDIQYGAATGVGLASVDLAGLREDWTNLLTARGSKVALTSTVSPQAHWSYVTMEIHQGPIATPQPIPVPVPGAG